MVKIFQEKLVPILFLLALPGLLPAADETVSFKKVQKGDKTYIYAVNHDPNMPFQIMFDFSALGNLKFSAALPVSQILPPKKSRLMGWLETIDKTKSFAYSVRSQLWFGDPTVTPDTDYPYLFPYGHGVKQLLNQGYFGSDTHGQCYCLDFNLAEGSKVCAARAGVVVKVKQDSNSGGAGKEFGLYGNGIWILHSDGTWASYGHLVQNGARVKLGQKVAAGQVIGISGNTGLSKGPHLHFDVNKAVWGGAVTTVPTKFLVQGGKLVDPQEGKYYYSFHPGMPAFGEKYADSVPESSLEQYVKPAAANGTVTFRGEKLDNKTIFYCSNGTRENLEITLHFPTLVNYVSTKPLPFTKIVPAGKEVYFLSLDIESAVKPAQYKYNAEWRQRGR